MKNKILLGCIVAGIILISSSFTTVIGQQNNNSSEKDDSPLYNIRALKSTNRKNIGLIDTFYIGKGKTTISLPTLDDIKLVFQDAIKRIKQMDETNFNKFIHQVIEKTPKNTLKKDIPQIYRFFNFIRDNPKIDYQFVLNENIQRSPDTIPPTADCITIANGHLWSPYWCLFLIITVPIWLPLLVLQIIYSGITYRLDCY